ncbi:MAG: cell division protein FtsZ [Bacteroidales bacterium]|nr:cell division protein FtsZ [Bacteroidales bacterium]
MKFTPKQKTSIIKVIGVGGGGSNAVNYMFKQGIEGVDFVVCNTDMQALSASPVPVKVQLGESGLGAGSIPEVAEQAALDSLEKIKAVLDEDTEMVFITAGMGGGTGTGAAPVIAKFARENGLLTVGIVTLPFHFEGRRKMLKAKQGIEEIRKYVDTLLVISNDKLRGLYGDLGLGNAFSHADNVLATAAKGIAELITVHGYVNVDFNDVKTVMKDSGKAIMGSAIKEGEDRAIRAIEDAMSSPLLNDNNVYGAKNILLYMTAGSDDITMDEITVITDYISDKCGEDSANVIWGRGIDENMGKRLGVTIIATGFDEEEQLNQLREIQAEQQPSPKIVFKDDTSDLKKSIFNLSDSYTPNTAKQEEPEEEIRVVKKVSHDEDNIMESDSSINPDTRKVYSLDQDVDDDRNEHHSSGSESDFFLPLDKDELMVKHTKPAVPKPTPKVVNEPVPVTKDNSELNAQAKVRIQRLTELSALKPTDAFKEEETPAYLRRKVQLSEPNYSSESQVSHYILSEDSRKNPIIKSDNSFLHDNVD